MCYGTRMWNLGKGPMPAIPSRRLVLEGPEAHHLPGWGRARDPKRVAILTRIAREAGRDPRMREFVINTVLGDRPGDDASRDYQRQTAAILAWVQANIRYYNETGEQLQDPFYTLRQTFGDCDDMSLLVAAMLESLKIEWRFVLSGRDRNGRAVRWIDGHKFPRKAKFTHIYVVAGYPPFQPTTWVFCDATMKTAPLGWDVVGAVERGERIVMPEMAAPPPNAMASLGAVDGGIASRVSQELSLLRADLRERLHWRNVIVGVVFGVVTSGLAGIVLNQIKTRRVRHRRNSRPRRLAA